jgi:hypothetical protein
MPAIGWPIPFSWAVACGSRARMWGTNSWKGFSDDEGVRGVAPWLDGWYMRCGGLDGERKLRAFDEKPDLGTSIPDLDERVPHMFSSWTRLKGP